MTDLGVEAPGAHMVTVHQHAAWLQGLGVF